MNDKVDSEQIDLISVLGGWQEVLFSLVPV